MSVRPFGFFGPPPPPQFCPVGPLINQETSREMDIEPEYVVFHIIQNMGCPTQREIHSQMHRMGLTHSADTVKRAIVSAMRKNAIERAGGNSYIVTDAALAQLKPDERVQYALQFAKAVAHKDKLAERRRVATAARARRKEAIQQEEKAFVAAFELGEALTHAGVV